MNSLLTRLNRVPPWGYRLLSKRSRDSIVKASGLSRTTVIRLSSLQSWETVKLEVAEKFAMGCGFSLTSQKFLIRRLKRAACHKDGLLSMRHLKPTGPFWKLGARANYLKFVTGKMLQ